MNIDDYNRALAATFDEMARRWPDLQPYTDDVSRCFQTLVSAFCTTDAGMYHAAFDRAGVAFNRMLRGYSHDTPSYRKLFEKAKVHFGGATKKVDPAPGKDRLRFIEQCRDFLTVLHRARQMAQPRRTDSADRPVGHVLMYRATQFLKGIEVSAEGTVTHWTLRNRSANESRITGHATGFSLCDADGTATSDAIFTIRKGADTLVIAAYAKNPLILHGLVSGPSADALRQVAHDLAGASLARLPVQDGVTAGGKDDFHAQHHDHRRRGSKRFSASCLLALTANRYWRFSRTLKLSDLVRKMSRVRPAFHDGFEFQPLCEAAFETKSCLSLGGYVTLYHLHLPDLNEDVFALDGYGQVVLIGRNFIHGDPSRFERLLTPYVTHFVATAEDVCPSRFFFHVASHLCAAAPPARTAAGLALSYGNWRVGDCSFALTSIRQVADLGYEVDILNQDSELIGLDPHTAQGAPHVRALFGEAAMSRIRFNADYLDGLTHLMLGSLGLDPCDRFAFQSRGRTFGNLWQKTMFPEWDGRRRDQEPGSPAVVLQPAQPFGIFFTLDLEKRRWIEQETFLHNLALWTQDLRTPVRIILNGMTSYRHPHLLNEATLETFDREAGIVAELGSRIMRKVRTTELTSIAELNFEDKCRAIHDTVHFCIGPLGSGTVVPSVLYAKPSLIYSSHALLQINRDSYRNLDLLIGPQTDLVPQHWVTDSDTRDHRIFPEAEMTSYSISPDRVLDLASAQITYHVKRSG